MHKQSTCANWATDCPDSCLGCLMYREEIIEDHYSERKFYDDWDSRRGD